MQSAPVLSGVKPCHVLIVILRPRRQHTRVRPRVLDPLGRRLGSLHGDDVFVRPLGRLPRRRRVRVDALLQTGGAQQTESLRLLGRRRFEFVDVQRARAATVRVLGLVLPTALAAVGRRRRPFLAHHGYFAAVGHNFGRVRALLVDVHLATRASHLLLRHRSRRV